VAGALALALAAGARGQEAEQFPPGPPVPTGVAREGRLPTASVTATVLDRRDLDALHPLSLDALLREEPSLSLFGGPSGWIADPATQGLSLRAAGPGGASRAVLLVDGVPALDPFSGGASWPRIPPGAVERVEMVQGPGVTLWGTPSTGGLVHVVTRPPGVRGGEVWASHGERGATSLALGLTDRAPGQVPRWSARVDADWLEVGDAPLAAAGRSGVGEAGEARNRTLLPKLEYRPRRDVALGLAAWAFDEDRRLGAAGPRSEVDALGGSTTLRLGTVPAGQWDALVFTDARRGRRDADAAFAQETPADLVGGSLQWTRRFLRRSGLPGPHLFTAGVDARWTDGESREARLDAEGARRPRRAGGRQLLLGLFGRDVDTIYPWLEVAMGARLDYWRSVDGFVEAGGPEAPRRETVPDRDVVNLSARTDVRVLPVDALTLRLSNANALRPPSLAEQYATSRTRDDVTLSTPTLDPERTVQWEAAVEYRGLRGLVTRATAFWHEVWDAVGTAALPEGAPAGDCVAGGTCRRRANLDRARVLGGEVGAEYVWVAGWALRAAYVHQWSRVGRATADPALEGERLPGVARHQLLAGVRHQRPGWPTVDARVRYVGARDAEDRRHGALGSAVVVDLAASLPVGRSGEVFAAAENLLDAAVETGAATGGAVTAAPRLVRAGLRFAF
jgi:outer membrane receptor protein involved in Fe transport